MAENEILKKEKVEKPTPEQTRNLTTSEPDSEEELVDNLASADSSLEKPPKQDS